MLARTTIGIENIDGQSEEITINTSRERREGVQEAHKDTHIEREESNTIRLERSEEKMGSTLRTTEEECANRG